MSIVTNISREQLLDCLEQFFKAKSIDIPTVIIELLTDYAFIPKLEWLFKGKEGTLERELTGFDPETWRLGHPREDIFYGNHVMEPDEFELKIFKIELKVISFGTGIKFGLCAQEIRKLRKTGINKPHKTKTRFVTQSYWQMIGANGKPEFGSTTKAVKHQNEYWLHSRTNSKKQIKHETNGSRNGIIFQCDDTIGCQVELYPLNEEKYRIRRYISAKLNNRKRTRKNKIEKEEVVDGKSRVYGVIKYMKNGKIIEVDDPGLEGKHLAITLKPPYNFRILLEDDATVSVL